MGRTLAPLVLFAYNRFDALQRTVECLKENTLAKDTKLYIFSDAEKNSSQATKVNAVRAYIHTISGFRSVTIFEAEQNKGLAKSVISGVTDILNRYGKVIVVEDDLLTAPQFLSYMNDALDFYQHEEKIWSISGYQYPFKMPTHYKESVYLSYRASSWGWATWKDRWDTIDWDIKDYDRYKNNPFRILHFCKGGTDLDKMLRYQMQGKIDSWAIRWCYNQSCQNKYTVYPAESLVNNIGTDGSGTHCDPTSQRFQTKLAENYRYSFGRDLAVNPYIMHRFRKCVNRSVIRKIARIFNTVKAKLVGG